VYYALVWPTGIIMKLRGRDPMNRKFDAELKTYRVKHESANKNQMERPF